MSDPHVVLVRHAEPDADGRVMGRGHDPGLTEHGRRQATGFADRLDGLLADGTLPPVTGVVTSGAARTAATAAPLTAAGLPAAVVDPRWAERDLGQWSGRPWDEVLAAMPERAHHDPAAWDAQVPPGGESQEQVAARVAAALAQPPTGTVVVVTHAGPLRAALAQVLALPPGGAHRLDVRYARATVLRWAGDVPVLARHGA